MFESQYKSKIYSESLFFFFFFLVSERSEECVGFIAMLRVCVVFFFFSSFCEQFSYQKYCSGNKKNLDIIKYDFC